MSVNKKFFIGNLDPCVSKEDICHLFGLEATSYLRSSCWVELATDANGKSKGYGFVSVPEHIAQQLVKFSGIDFYGKELKIEPAKDKDEKETADEEKQDIKKKSKTEEKPKKGGNGGARRGGGRGGFGGRQQSNRGHNQMYNHNGQFRQPRGGFRQRYNLPVLAQDQIFALIDSGVNLTNGRFSQSIDYVIARALAAGVQKMIVTGNRLNASKSAVVMAKTRPNILFASVGIHPHFVKDDFNERALEALKELVNSPEVVCIGEIGLDFNRDYSPREDQKKAFEKQLELACQANKPILAHDRDSHDALVEIFDKFKSQLPTVIIHCFTGKADEIRAYVARGFYIGITGFICKEKHGKDLRDAIENGVCPLDKIVIQSDAPYMIPNLAKTELDPVSESLLEFCWEGNNEPCTLPVVVRCIAKCLNKDIKEVAEVTSATAKTIFNFP